MACEYKDSGIEWIGQIPKEWEVIKLKYESQFINGYAFDSNDFKIDGEIRVVRIGDIGLSIDWDNCIYVKYPAFSLDTFKVSNGDILIAMSGATTGKCCLVTNAKEAYINQRVGIIRSDKRKHVFYSLLAPYFKEYVNLNNMGSAQPNISSKAIGEFPLVMPKSLIEQQKIADYLDKVCGEVDKMMALQETMIEELKAYKQSVITEAVTKGLNPNVPMRNSGIDWIGEIPEHWSTTKIKKIARTNSGSTPRNISDGENSNIVWIRTTDINDDVVYDSSLHLTSEEYSSASCPMLDEGTCVVAMYGGGGTIGKSGMLGVKATINQALCSMEVGDSFTGEYLFCILRSVRYYWMKYAVGTRKDPNINQEIVRNMIIPFPPIDEQRAIATYLDTKCSEIDSLIDLKQAKIEELKEYKKSVIYEYVTGKKEVV